MAPSRRPYEAPVVRVEIFNLGIYGDYGLETSPYMPVMPTEDDGLQLRRD